MNFYPTSVIVCALLLLRPLFAEEPPATKPTPLQHASAHGVSFDYPAELTFTSEMDKAGTKLRLRNKDEFPWLMVQVYSIELTPEEALEINIRISRKIYAKKNWQVNVGSTQETIAGRSCQGKEIVYKANDIEFRQRFFTLEIYKRTVLVMTVSRTSHDEYTQSLLRPITSSLQ